VHGVHDVHGCHTVGAHRGHTLCDRFRALDRRSAYLPSLGIRGARNAMARCHALGVAGCPQGVCRRVICRQDDLRCHVDHVKTSGLDSVTQYELWWASWS
jgi:hypothetical protein